MLNMLPFTALGAFLCLMLASPSPYADFLDKLNDAVQGATGVGGRCGPEGEGTVYVRNRTLKTKFIRVEGVRPGIGYYEQDLAPRSEFHSSICNRDGIRVKVYTENRCGKTFLGESRFVRVYNEEIVEIVPGGIKFAVGDVLEPLAKMGGLALTAIAEGYGVDPAVLAQLGVNEARMVDFCRNADPRCLRELYNFLPSQLKQKVDADRCLRTAFRQSSQPPLNPRPPATGSRPTHSLVCIVNNTGIPINYQSRWGSSAWENHRLMPNMENSHFFRLANPSQPQSPPFQVLLDTDLAAPGNQNQLFNLDRWNSVGTNCKNQRQKDIFVGSGNGRYLLLNKKR